MRAMIIKSFGGADMLHWGDLPTPEPTVGEVLVRVVCAGVNPADWKTREGKLSAYIQYHFPFVLGFDLAGIVEAVGEGVDAFSPGDRVFGMSGRGATGAMPNIASPTRCFLRRCRKDGASRRRRRSRLRGRRPMAGWPMSAR
ncbi:MAG TPA: alcohol dehydrogenase catalytic domain-containing protein [Sphingopyxis sp.]|nr:alcohol dehydrogenase catalytic domain-containing protein [Sphingopyxis sp.]